MLRKIASVSGWTLVSRVTGFVRDACMAAIMGAGPVADAFVVAMRLPNHFRAIFAEGAFNAAFVPKYAKLLGEKNQKGADSFASHIFSLVLAVQAIILVCALLGMSWIVYALTFGFPADPSRFELAVSLSRITFPYLFFVTLVTVLSGILNAHGRFAAAAAAPVLLNLSLVVFLFLAAFFPTAGHAAAWGFFSAGILELALLWYAVKRSGLAPEWKKPVLDKDMKEFFRALGPAVIGSAGVQIAMFADTLIASLLPTGAVSSIYYADRLYQLPVGVIAIAAGTVLLPEMSRKFASGDITGAYHAQNRAVGLTFVLTIPFFIAFLTMPELILSALFQRGAFDSTAALASAKVLFAYSVGLPAVMLLRSAVASFYARQDTTTPVLASLTAVGINVVLKLVLVKPLGAPGLALATALGAWINLIILVMVGMKRDLMKPDRKLFQTILISLAASVPLLIFACWSPDLILAFFSDWRGKNIISLGVCGITGGIMYLSCTLMLFRLLDGKSS